MDTYIHTSCLMLVYADQTYTFWTINDETHCKNSNNVQNNSHGTIQISKNLLHTYIWQSVSLFELSITLFVIRLDVCASRNGMSKYHHWTTPLIIPVMLPRGPIIYHIHRNKSVHFSRLFREKLKVVIFSCSLVFFSPAVVIAVVKQITHFLPGTHEWSILFRSCFTIQK